MDQHNLVDTFKMERRMYKNESVDKAMHSSPLHRMPTEILCEIIKAYLSNDGNIATIMQICSRIRQVIFSMPNIWNGIWLSSANATAYPQFAYIRVRSCSYIHVVLITVNRT
jgi:hypothetical protein